MSPVFYIMLGGVLALLLASWRLSGGKATLYLLYLGMIAGVFEFVPDSLPAMIKYPALVLLLLLPSVWMFFSSNGRDDCQIFAVVADTPLNEGEGSRLEEDLRKVLGEKASVVGEHDENGSSIIVIMKGVGQMPDLVGPFAELHSRGVLVKEEDDVFRYEPGQSVLGGSGCLG